MASSSLAGSDEAAAAEEAAAAAVTAGADAAGGGEGEGGGGGGSDEESEDEGARDPERVWRREVEETFLRCIKMRFAVVGPGCGRAGQGGRRPDNGSGGACGYGGGWGCRWWRPGVCGPTRWAGRRCRQYQPRAVGCHVSRHRGVAHGRLLSRTLCPVLPGSPCSPAPPAAPAARPQNNVVIELNALKIAEDRTFADCAKYMLTALLNLALPPPPKTPADYVPLFKTGEAGGGDAHKPSLTDTVK